MFISQGSGLGFRVKRLGFRVKGLVFQALQGKNHSSSSNMGAPFEGFWRPHRATQPAYTNIV